MDQRTVALDLVGEERGEGARCVAGDCDVEGRVGGGLRGGGEDLRRGIGEGLRVVEEGEGVDVVLGEGMGAGDGEGPRIL